jgi:hypothetical protein
VTNTASGRGRGTAMESRGRTLVFPSGSGQEPYDTCTVRRDIDDQIREPSE